MENAFSRKGCKILETRLFHLKSNFTVTSTSQNHKKTFSKTWQWHVMSVLGATIVSGPPASWSFDFLAEIPQNHSYISPGTIDIAQKRLKGPLPGAFSFLVFFQKILQFYKTYPHLLIFGSTIKCYTISESSCLTRRRAILVIDLVASTNEK